MRVEDVSTRSFDPSGLAVSSMSCFLLAPWDAQTTDQALSHRALKGKAGPAYAAFDLLNPVFYSDPVRDNQTNLITHKHATSRG